MVLAINTDILPMEARLIASLPRGDDWLYEPKWDGFRCIAYKDGDKISLHSKSGKPLERYFPDIVAVLQNIRAEKFAIDGELVLVEGGAFSFSGLQLRLHPAASRVRALAAKNPASFILFDMILSPEGKNLLKKPLSFRRKELEKFYARYCKKEPQIELSPQADSLATAREWLENSGGRLDGIVAKKAGDVYQPGERIMQKYKTIRTADCVVGGFRYGTDSPYAASLLLGLYDDEGRLNHVGFTTLKESEKPALTKKLEKLVKAPGFTGKAPGGPSRWSTERTGEWQPLKPKLVVEVSYDHVSDDRFRHGTKLIRWRPDKAPEQCRMEQIRQPGVGPLAVLH